MKWIVGQAHRLPPENQNRQPTRLPFKKNDIHREKIIVQIKGGGTYRPPSQINPFAVAARESAAHKQTEML